MDYEQLDPKQDRIKLEGDEYEAHGTRKQRKSDLASQATFEIYRSLDSLPVECKAALKSAVDDTLQSGTLLGYPMVNMRVRILDGRWSNIRSKNPIIFQMCAT